MYSQNRFLEYTGKCYFCRKCHLIKECPLKGILLNEHIKIWRENVVLANSRWWKLDDKYLNRFQSRHEFLNTLYITASAYLFQMACFTLPIYIQLLLLHLSDLLARMKSDANSCLPGAPITNHCTFRKYAL